ncbi:MAG: alpha/beta hydrolase [Microbacterium gubbeenense]
MRPVASYDWQTPDGATLHDQVFGSESASPEHSVVIVCGAFLPALVYAPFASALVGQLGSDWSVHVYDRRGKGESSPVDDSYSFDTELDDVRTALRETGARHLLGHSLGGSIVLHAVRSMAAGDDPLLPATTTVYDPAINLDGSLDTSWLPKFQQLVDKRRWGRAMAVIEKVMGMSSTLSRAPSWMVAGVMGVSVRTGLRGMSKAVFPAGVAELTAAFAEEARGSDFAHMPPDLCILVGEHSADYFRATAEALNRSMPDARFVVVRKGIHGSVPAVRHPIVKTFARWLLEEPMGDVALEVSEPEPA